MRVDDSFGPKPSARTPQCPPGLGGCGTGAGCGTCTK